MGKFHFSFLLALLAACFPGGSPARAQPVITWTGATDSTWATATNWSGGIAPGSGSLTTNTDIASFDLTGAAGTIQLDFATLGATYYFGTLQFTSTATLSRTFGASSATAGVIVLNGTGANNLILDNQSATALMTISPLAGGTGAGLSLRLNTANSTINTAAGGIFIDANITEATAGRGITKTGAGLLTLAGTNTFTGGITASEGEFKLGSLGAINAGGANALTLTGTGAFSVNGFNATVSGLSGTAGTFLQNNGATNAVFTVNNAAGVSTFGGTIQNGSGGGTFALAKTGAGELALGGTNTYTGPTTITNNGVVRATTATALSTSAVSINGGTLLASAGVTVNNAITILASSGGAYTATYNFGATTATASPTSTTGTGYTAGAVVQGNNNGTTTMLGTTSASTTYTGASGANNAGAAARTGVLNTASGGSAYFEFTLTPTSGNINLASISFGTRSTSTGPQAYTLRSSLDGYTADLATGTIVVTGTPWALKTNTLATPATSAFATPITFRIYGYNGAGTGTAGTANWRIDDLALAGTVVVPSTNILGSDITSGTATFASPITLNSAVQLSSATGGTVLFSGVIADGTGTNSVTKIGGGSVVLSNTNTYAGATAVTAGNLFVNGSLASGSAVGVSGTGTLAGSGTAAGTVTINSGGTIAPGAGANITGVLNTGVLTFATGGSYKWNILNAAGSAGTGFSQISASSLNLTGLTTDNSFTIFLTTLSSSGTAGALSSFNTSTNQSWSILTSASAITNFVASRFTLNTSGFANALAGGTFTLGLGNSNQDLVLTYTSNSAITSGTIWDDNGSTPGTGNTGGLWSASKWTADAAGTTNTLPFTAGGTATFSAGTNGTTYTVSVDVAVTANGLNFEEGTVTIAHTTGGSLTLTGPTIAVATGAAAIISESIAGTVGLGKSGTGTLTLSGPSNSYTGGTTVTDGTLIVGSASALGAAANTLTMNGGTLDLKGTSITVGALSGTGGTITSSTGSATLAVGDATVAAAFAGSITGPISLTIQNQGTTGTVTLTGANTFTGSTAVNSGFLSLGNLSALGGTSGITVASGAQLQLTMAAGGSYLAGGVITLGGVGPVGAANAGALILAPGVTSGTTSTLANDINLNADATINSTVSGATLAIGGKLTGSGALTKAGAGTLTMTGTGSTATGATIIAGGTTNANAANVLPSGPLSLAQAGTIGAALNIVESQSVGSLSSTYSGVTANLSNSINISAGKTLTITQTTSLTYGTPGVAPEAGKTSFITGSGGIALAVGSTATLTLDGTNTFTGGVTVSGGELKLNSTGAINSSGANALAVSGTGIVTLNGFATNVADLSGIAGTLQNANATPATLAVNKATGASAFNGTITDGTGGGALALTKGGAGELALAGNNAYSGPTTVNNGTLRAGSNNALGTSAVTITNGNLYNAAGVTTSNNIAVAGVAQNVLIAGWDFQTTTTGGTAAAAAPASPSVYVANFGVGNLYLDGTNGSSTWVTASTGNEVTAFAGTTNVNVGPGFGTTSALTLALIGGATITGPPATLAANGKSIVFKFSMAGANTLNVSYAAQRTATGFASQAWSYSTDGINWTPGDTITTTPTSFGTISLTSITALANAPTAYLRVTFDGATNATGNNRLDNVQFNTLQPATIALGSDVPGASTIFSGNVSLSSTASLTAAAGGTTTFSGNIVNGTGAQSIMKSGAGTVVLSGANTYSGTTAVSAGILKLDSGTALPPASAILLQGGTLALKDGATHTTTGTLTLGGNSTIAFGTPSATTILSVADSSAAAWSGTLTIAGWNGSLTGGGTSQFMVGANANALTPAQLSQINFSGYALGANILPTGEIVPTGIVPEPGTILGLGAVGLGFAGWLRRRRAAIL